MDAERRRAWLWVLVVVCVMARAQGLLLRSAPGAPGVPAAWQPHQPDLNTASWRELACLPGVGPARARAIVAGRARLGVPLTPRLAGLLPGVGPQTVQALEAALGQPPVAHPAQLE
jgi:DNA uptake protein ComE-like DNA-binding protein